jgi:hypothetical protein
LKLALADLTVFVTLRIADVNAASSSVENADGASEVVLMS